MILENKNNRMGVFIFYDQDEIIDDYVKFMLDSFQEAVDKLVIVSNVDLTPANLEVFKKYTDSVLVRENVGLDAGAFKYVYDNFKEIFKNYDELIVMNDTFYGPFEPFEKIIKKMEQHDIDFWGLCSSYETKNGFGTIKNETLPIHIQTFFIAYRNSVTSSHAFNEYWENYSVEENNSFSKVVLKHETMFTSYLENNGFKWDTYLDLSHYESKDYEKNFNMYAFSSYQLLKYFHAPFIKRKNFVQEKNDALYFNDGTDVIKAINYIKNNSKYNIDMIYKNLIRVYRLAEIYQGLNLNYLIDNTTDKVNSKKSLIIVDVESNDFLFFANEFQINADIEYITTKISTNKKIREVKSICHYLSENKNLLENDYDYITIIRGKKRMNSYKSIDESNWLRIIDNTIGDNNTYANLLSTFDNDRYLGALLAPVSFHNGFFNNLTAQKFKQVIKESNERLNRKDFICANFDFICFKSEIVKLLDKQLYSDELFTYDILRSVKKANKYVGKVYNQDTATNDLVSYEKMFANIFDDSQKKHVYPLVYINLGSRAHKLIRKHVPLDTRAKLKKIVKRKDR